METIKSVWGKITAPYNKVVLFIATWPQVSLAIAVVAVVVAVRYL